MARTAAQISADRIRIEDEVWEEAFSTRVRSRPRRGPEARQLRSVPDLGSVPDPRPVPAPGPGRARPVRAASAAAPRTRVITNLDAEPPVRRTVRIEGRGAERSLRYTPSATERISFSPDRLAMWAVLLGFLLVLVAVLSSQI